MKKHVNIRISGKVQGVWFRKNAQIVADQLGVKGFVRNEPDGSVYLEAEGAPEPLERFIEWCGKGPERSEVKKVEAEQTAELRDFDAFRIQR